MKISDCIVVVRGGGDIASGTIHTLFQCGFKVMVLEAGQPTTIRRQAAFSEAIYQGEAVVEGVLARHVDTQEEVIACWTAGVIPMVQDEEGDWIDVIRANVIVDAILAKQNLGTKISMADCVIGLGPGFNAGVDVHVVIETMRGHELGRMITCGSALKNTGVPGKIGGFDKERVIHSPAMGIMKNVARIGDLVKSGDLIARIDETPVYAAIDGVLRGLLREGLFVPPGFKIADIDPRIEEKNHCFTISDKARTIAGSVLQAIIMYGGIDR